MANVIKPKRSNTAAKVPNTSELLSGELGVNMADKKVYINNGTSIIQVGAGVLSALGDVSISSPTNGQSLSWNGTAWVNSTGSGSGTVTSVAALTLGTTGTDLSSTVATGTTTPVITLQVPTASATNRGALSSADWTTFNNKQAALGFTPYNSTNPSGYIALSSAITGYTVGTNTALEATDTLLAGLGKIQGQINAKGAGTVTSVTGTAPVVSSGGATPAISMAAATASVNGYMTSTYASKLDGIAAGATNVTNTNQLTNGAGYITSSGTSAACSGNAATATTLSGDQSNWASLRTSAVANMLSWKNYGNGHIIFDASASTSPTGSAVNNTNAAVAWTGTYPTLMGWNGSSTYGVRVDSARISDSTSGSSASCTGNAATATTATNLSGGTVAATTITATGNITAYYSDERLKTRLGTIENALAKVQTLDGFYYEPNEIAQSLGYKVKREVGVSAQQVQAILPEIIAPAPIDNKYLTVDYERLVPLLIEAIKELKSEVDELKNIIVSNNGV